MARIAHCKGGALLLVGVFGCGRLVLVRCILKAGGLNQPVSAPMIRLIIHIEYITRLLSSAMAVEEPITPIKAPSILAESKASQDENVVKAEMKEEWIMS